MISRHNQTVKFIEHFNPLSANPTKRPNTLNCLSVFGHFVNLALKGLRKYLRKAGSRSASRCRIIIPFGDVKAVFSSGLRLAVAITYNETNLATSPRHQKALVFFFYLTGSASE